MFNLLGFIKLCPRLRELHIECKTDLNIVVAEFLGLEKKKEPDEKLIHWCYHAQVAYEGSKETILKRLKAYWEDRGFSGVQVEVKHYYGGDFLWPRFTPAFFVAEISNQIVISVRGSESFGDWITDLKFFPRNFDYHGISGKAHGGFLEAAENVLKRLRKTGIVKLIQENPSHNVVVTGHSLGGAVSVLLSFLLKKEELSGENLECWTFGCPPCITKDFITKADFIHNVVLNDDIIARLSHRNALTSLYEHNDDHYVKFLNKKWFVGSNEEVSKKAGDIWEIIKTKRNWYSGEEPELVCPGILYHLLAEPEHQSEPIIASKYTLYISPKPIYGLSWIVFTDTMIFDHTWYGEWLKQIWGITNVSGSSSAGLFSVHPMTLSSIVQPDDLDSPSSLPNIPLIVPPSDPLIDVFLDKTMSIFIELSDQNVHTDLES